MPRLAEWVASPNGQAVAAISRRFGVDPCASFSDDVLAMNVRALIVMAEPEAEAPPAPEPEDEWAAAAAANEREWLAGGRVG